MKGINRNNGKWIDGLDHLKQSIAHILTTHQLEVIRLATYGSNLADLIDQPFNETTINQILAASIDALARWEPRIIINQAQIDRQAQSKGELTLNFSGQLSTNNQTVDLPITIVGGNR